jgi:hypothetical protein
MWWVVAVVAVVVGVATYLTWTASRVDRLHARAAAANAALDAHLVRRAAAAVALAEATQLATLAYAGRIALDAPPEDREAAENDLTRQLRTVVEVHPLEDVESLVAVSRRVALARQVHNDVVRDALAMRRRIRVRLFRLARRHPVPAYFDIDDPTVTPVAAVPPTVAGQRTGGSGTAGSGTAGSGTGRPVVGEPVVGESGVGRPVVGRPVVGRPRASDWPSEEPVAGA